MPPLGVDATRAASFAIVQHAMGVVPLALLAVVVLFGDVSWRDAAARADADDSE